MLSFYRFFRWILFLSVLLFLLIVFTLYEGTPQFSFLQNQKWMYSVLQATKEVQEFVFHDSAQKKMDAKFQSFQTEINHYLFKRTDAIRDLEKDPAFQKQLFFYYLNQDTLSFGQIVHRLFVSFPDFEDMILLDKNKKLIYKYGGKIFSINFLSLYQNMDFRFDQKFYVVYHNIDDTILDQEVQVVVYFNYSELIKKIKSRKDAVFCYFNHTLIRSYAMNLSLFRLYKQDILSKKEVYAGLKLIRVFPLKIGDKVFGYAGMVFPYRRVQFIFKTSGKILLLLLIPIFLFLLNHQIIVRLREMEIKQKEILNRRELSKSEADSDEEDLAWVDSYIKKESEDDK